MNNRSLKLFVTVHALALLASCGGGSQAVSSNVHAATTTPYIYAEVNSFSGTAQSSVLVEVLEDSTETPITEAEVVINDVSLSYNAADQAYEGHITVNPGDAVSLLVTVGTGTYAAVSAQFTSYPTIYSPQPGAIWASGIDNTVTWSIGPLNKWPTMYGLGILDAQNPDGALVWPPDNYLLTLAADARSYSVPAYTLTPGNRLVLVGISSVVSIAGAAPDSALVISGFQHAPVTVIDATLSAISITPANPSIPKGTDQQFNAMGHFSDNSLLDVTNQATWESSAISKATIAVTGLAYGVNVGSSIITARVGGLSDATILTVTPAVLESIRIDPSNWTMDPGATKQFWATGTFSDGSIKDITTLVTWTSSDETLAAISNVTGSNGMVSAYRTGTTAITATTGNVSSSTTLTLAQLLSIALTPAGPAITKGAPQQFAATGTFSDGGRQDVTRMVIWKSSNTDVAAISNEPASQGYATSGLSGTSSISAEFDGVTGSTMLTVTPWRMQALSNLEHYPAVVWSGTQFVAVGGYYPGSGSSVLTSPDGLTWTKQTSGTSYTLSGLDWTGAQFVAVGGHGSILTSPDGVTWTLQSSGTTVSLSSIVWTGSQFFAVGGGNIFSSSDGITWSSQYLGGPLYGIAYSGSQFIAVGEFGSIYTSPDGANWTSRSQSSGTFSGIIWTGTQFVMTGWYGYGAIVTSSDGITWSTQSTGSHTYRFGLCNGQILGLGDDGSILTSSDGATWSSSPSGVWNGLSSIACSGTESVIMGSQVILMNP